MYCVLYPTCVMLCRHVYMMCNTHTCINDQCTTQENYFCSNFECPAPYANHIANPTTVHTTNRTNAPVGNARIKLVLTTMPKQGTNGTHGHLNFATYLKGGTNHHNTTTATTATNTK